MENPTTSMKMKSNSFRQLILERFKDSGRHFTAGGIAGIIEVCFAHPFDCMKTRLQIGQFLGIRHCIQGTLRNEGPTGFYKGLLPPLIVETPKRAIKFTAFDYYWQTLQMTDNLMPAWTRYSLSGLLTGITEAFLVCPFEVVKIRLQSELYIPLAQQRSAITVAREIARTHGWGTEGLYRGIGANLWRHTVWNSCYFGIYHNLRTHLFTKEDSKLNGNLFPRFLIASLSAITANLANIPFDVAKSRIQGPQPASGRIYFTTWQTISLIHLKQEGFGTIYRRLLPFAFIFGPGGGMMLVVYESIYGWLLRQATGNNTVTLDNAHEHAAAVAISKTW